MDAGVAGVARVESSGVNVAALRGYMLGSYVHNNIGCQTGRSGMKEGERCLPSPFSPPSSAH